MNEVEVVTLRDVLPKFLKDFFNDFCVDDVKDAIQFIFNELEMQNILSEPTENKKILQLFWILQQNEHYIQPFLKRISEWYSWLSQSVYEELRTLKYDDLYFQTLRHLFTNFEKHIDFNVHRMKFYWPIRLALLELKRFNFVILNGELGIGKKWILLDVCSEYEVLKAMGFNILWLDVYNCKRREDDLKALQQLQLLLKDPESVWRTSEFDDIENKILFLQQRIRECLTNDKFKDCLLVLSGVQNSKTLRNLKLGCKTVIITRNQNIAKSLSESATKEFHINTGFTLTECYQYFERVLKRSRNTFPKITTEIFSLSHGQPLLLSIIANNLKFSNRNDWTDWKHNLENLEIPDKLTMVVDISLKVLNPEEVLLYKMLSIFPHSVEIPLKLLASVWEKTECEAETVLQTFAKYSIIKRKMSNDEVAYLLPHIYSLYLQAIHQNTDRSDLHNRVILYYRLNEMLRKKCNDNSFSFCNDYYFYHCIGYHLKASNNAKLFPKLFLDFIFLGEKLRYDGFSNTVGDLKHFEKEITGDNLNQKQLLSEILTFLPHAENLLLLSKDTNLLQYAVMADGIIKEEAIKQATLLESRIWFEDKGDFHQRRQVVRLPKKIHMIKSIEADICIIALKTNDILLMDLSLGYKNEPIYLTGNQYPISQMKLILNDNYVITLDINGHLKVWSIVDDRRRSACFDRKVNPLNLINNHEMQKRRCKQVIEKNIRGPIRAFYIENKQNNEIDLHLAFANGDICIYFWDVKSEEFKIKSLPILPTKVQNISYLSKILNKYYMVLNILGDIYFFNLCDSSQTARSFEWQKQVNLIYVGEFKAGEINSIIFVYFDKVLCLNFPPQKFKLLNGELKLIYSIDEDINNSIICACMSHDGHYLVLGTKHGLIVFNIATQSIVLRGNISEAIACVEIYPLDDNLYKYLILCASDQSQVLNLFALKQLENSSIAWSYRLNNKMKESSGINGPQLEPDVWLQGKKLYDLNQKDYSMLVAVDSKNRIHHVSTTGEKKWSISLPPDTAGKITAISMFDSNILCAYDNGQLFDITKRSFVQSFTNECISYLQMINDNIFVASSDKAQKSVIQDLENEETYKLFDTHIYKTKIYSDRYAILVNPMGNFVVIDISNRFQALHESKGTRGFELGGCDLKSDYLVLVTLDCAVFIYKLMLHCEDLSIKCVQNTKPRKHAEYSDVTSVAISSEAYLLAVGMKNGVIDVYQIDRDEIKLIHRLTSHQSQIFDLKFSPKSDVLASCSEQLCFWNVSFMINNPIDTETKQNRRSSRFRSGNSLEEKPVSLVALKSNSIGNTWAEKSGLANKPELLSCIKFVGSKADIFFANGDFTNFFTIDNEGVYYHLCVHNFSRGINTCHFIQDT